MKHLILCWCLLAPLHSVAAETVYLDDLEVANVFCFRGQAAASGKAVGGTALMISGKTFKRGIGVAAHSEAWVDLHNSAERFTALLGVDDAARDTDPAVIFRVIADDVELYNSGAMQRGDAAKAVNVDLRNRRHLLLLVTVSHEEPRSNVLAAWAEARLELTGAKPEIIRNPNLSAPKEIRTPAPGPAPRINGPAVYGCRPGRPFLYRIPAQGTRPMKFSAANLPITLSLDETTGIITGRVPTRPGDYLVTLRAENNTGSDIQSFRIVVGEELALTPPMGWNHWYTWYHRITDQRMRNAADAMVSSGMADVGYSYVSIDDCWMRLAPEQYEAYRKRLKDVDQVKVVKNTRDEIGKLIPSDNFPDMKGLTDYIHQLGLKAGIYTSPGPQTCARYEGAFGHEWQDALSFASWGFDLLKYDWCTYGQRTAPLGEGLEYFIKPYRLMGGILQAMDRDIQLNLCQYGMANVWEWGADVGGDSWRTGGDLGFTLETDGIYKIAAKNLRIGEHARPGHWNDPDYLILGVHGDAYNEHGDPEPTPLEAGEQYSYMSLWCLMASPLFFSGDMERLDDFTVNILCNPEMIEVNQDELGLQAKAIVMNEQVWVLQKPMSDGSVIVGLFNVDEIPRKVAVTWQQLNVYGSQQVRDLWRQKDLGAFETGYEVTLPRKDVTVLRLRPIAGK